MTIYIEVSEDIAAYIEDVFNYTMDVGNLASWQAQLVSAYTEDEPGVGAVTTQVRKIAGIKVESQIECIQFEPPYQVAFRVIKGPVPFVFTQTFQEIDGGTRLTINIEGDVVGPLKMLGENRVRSQTESEMMADLASLKAIFEG